MAWGKKKDEKAEAEVDVEAGEAGKDGKDGKDGKKEKGKHARHQSATITALMETRKQASEEYAQAQKAERAYLAKKHAAAATSNYTDTKTHFKEAFKHFGLAFKGLFQAIRTFPHILAHRRAERRREADKAKRARAEERMKKLEEQLAKDAEKAEADAAEAAKK